MKATPILYLYLVFMIYAIASWFVNVGSFVQCDFDAPYKCEVAHGIGIFIPPAAMVTVWFDDDSGVAR